MAIKKILCILIFLAILTGTAIAEDANTGLTVPLVDMVLVPVTDDSAAVVVLSESEPLLDGFEDGDYGNNPVWVRTGSGTIEVQSQVKKNVNYALKMDCVGNREAVRTNAINVSLGSDWYVWLMSTTATGYNGIYLQNGAGADLVGIRTSANQFQYYRSGGWVNFNPNIIFSANTWYRLRINYPSNGTVVNYYIYDANGVLLGGNTGLTPGTQAQIASLYFSIDFPVNGTYTYIDDISYGFTVDSDADGVPDANDACPSTPLGEVVDATGCSCSQKVCDDGNPCTNDSCDEMTAQCNFVNDNANECGFPRDCSASTCILKESPPYFYWKLYPNDNRDYCLEGSCEQYSCDLVSEDYNAQCNIADTSELEAEVENLKSEVTQLKQQNLELQQEMGILEASVNTLKQSFQSFVSTVNAYLLNLPKGLRQGMLCGALEQTGGTSAGGFGLHCEINDKGQCFCTEA